MAFGNSIVYKFAGDSTKFVKSVRGMERESDSASRKIVKNFGKVRKTMSLGLGLVGVAGAGMIFKDMITASIQFDKQLREVFTLLPNASKASFGEMEQQVRDFSAEVGIASSKVLPALYQALSAGVSQDNVFEFMRIAAEASIGGLTTLETSVDALSTVVNAYGSENITAQEASDILFTTVRLGKTNFEQLAASIANVIPTAAGLKVEFADVAAALSTLTAQGVKTSVATTAVRALLVELNKVEGALGKTFEAATGMRFTAFIAEGNTLLDALQVIQDEASRTDNEILDFFSSVEAGSAALGLLSTSKFADDVREMGDAAGAAAAAFDTMEASASRAAEKAAASWEGALTRMKPIVGWLMNGFANVVDGAIAVATEAPGVDIVTRVEGSSGASKTQARKAIAQAREEAGNPESLNPRISGAIDKLIVKRAKAILSDQRWKVENETLSAAKAVDGDLAAGAAVAKKVEEESRKRRLTEIGELGKDIAADEARNNLSAIEQVQLLTQEYEAQREALKGLAVDGGDAFKTAKKEAEATFKELIRMQARADRDTDRVRENARKASKGSTVASKRVSKQDEVTSPDFRRLVRRPKIVRKSYSLNSVEKAEAKQLRSRLNNIDQLISKNKLRTRSIGGDAEASKLLASAQIKRAELEKELNAILKRRYTEIVTRSSSSDQKTQFTGAEATSRQQRSEGSQVARLESIIVELKRIHVEGVRIK